MGRHSIPDPEDSAGEDTPAEPPTQRFGRQQPAEPDDGPGHREPGYPRSTMPRATTTSPVTTSPDTAKPITTSRTIPTPTIPSPTRTTRSRSRGAVARAAPPPRSSGAQHSGEWEGGEWTGSHRAVATGRRGVSIGVIAALVAVVVVVGAFILWRFFGDALSNRTDAAAARCVDGELAVAVVADPVDRRSGPEAGRHLQQERGARRRPLREGGGQARRLRSGRQRLHRQVARRTR